MSGLAMGMVLQAALLVSGADPYAEAREAHLKDGKPFLVLVGADWCPGCVTMKNSTIPAMIRAGQLKGVHYATVNYDENPARARALMQGNMLPQLMIFSKTPDGWHREQITGPTSSTAILGMMQRAIAAQAPKKPATTTVAETPTLDKSSGN
jgi:thiol-disulfide isomerase/thioredoxin